MKKASINVKIKENTENGGEVVLDSVFDARAAGVKRKDAEWDDFEVMGASNREEEEYVAPLTTDL